MKYRPLFDRLLVRPDLEGGPAPLVSEAGIVAPDAARGKVALTINSPLAWGEVVAAGPGAWMESRRHRPLRRRPMRVGVGDRVGFRHFAGQRDVPLGGETLVILTEDQVEATTEAESPAGT